MMNADRTGVDILGSVKVAETIQFYLFDDDAYTLEQQMAVGHLCDVVPTLLQALAVAEHALEMDTDGGLGTKAALKRIRDARACKVRRKP